MSLENAVQSAAGLDLQGLDADDIAKAAEYIAFLKERKGVKHASPQAPADPSAKKILIIDDDQEICELLHMFLVSHHYNVYLAFNARMGLEYFREVKPDMVFLDLKMPDMDGIEVLKVMHDLKDTPTVIITGHPEFVSDVQSSGVSIDGYLEKPLILEKVLRMLKRVLGGG